MLRSLIVCSLLLACSAFEAADPEKPPFNKEELEEILRKDHSDRISNIYDSANDIQCARRPRHLLAFIRLHALASESLRNTSRLQMGREGPQQWL